MALIGYHIASLGGYLAGAVGSEAQSLIYAFFFLPVFDTRAGGIALARSNGIFA